jgi:hypothetical protein
MAINDLVDAARQRGKYARCLIGFHRLQHLRPPGNELLHRSF